MPVSVSCRLRRTLKVGGKTLFAWAWRGGGCGATPRVYDAVVLRVHLATPRYQITLSQRVLPNCPAKINCTLLRRPIWTMLNADCLASKS